MKLPIIFIYGFLFTIVFLICALMWHMQMPDVYFVSRGKGLIADFVPPFVQTDGSGDFYIKPPVLVYAIWLIYFGCAVVIPAVASWLVMRFYDRKIQDSWHR